MELEFEIGDPAKVQTVLSKAKEMVKENNGEVNGNDFIIETLIRKFKVMFRINGSKVIIDITKKPFIATENMVEKEINKLFKEIME